MKLFSKKKSDWPGTATFLHQCDSIEQAKMVRMRVMSKYSEVIDEAKIIVASDGIVLNIHTKPISEQICNAIDAELKSKHRLVIET